MKKIYTILLVAGILISSCSERNKTTCDTELLEFSDSLFQTSVDSSFIAGASVMVYKGGEKLLDKSYGYACLELSVPIPERGIFEIGSITKQFTSAAILKLLEDGKLSLDDDITKYLDYDTKGRIIKIKHLLNHTSGIVSYTEIPEFWNMSLHTYKRDTLVKLIEQKDFLFEPGEALIYNNSGYFFLGLIIEKITGMSYEEYLAKEFFNPLGMKDTYYSSNLKIITNKVYGYNYNKDGLLQRPYLDHTWPYSAGSLCSTTEDLLIWMTSLHEGKIFRKQLYNLLITPDKLNDGSILRYAMGLTNFSNYGNKSISHGGGINGFLSETRYFPEADLYIICLVNTTGPKGADFFANELTWKILDKKEYDSQELDIELNSIEGKYSGQVRGRVLSLEVSALSNSIVLSTEENGEYDADTLRTYFGNNSWVDGNSIYIFTDDELRIDQVSGYLRLKKQ